MTGYVVFNLIVVLQLVLLAQSTDFVGGHGGRMGVAAVLFAALGGYMYALSTVTLGVGCWLSVFLALLATSIAALVLGWLFLRLRENEFLLATLAVQLGFLEVANNVSILGGPLGIRNIPSPSVRAILHDPALNAIWVLGPGVMMCSVILVRLLGEDSQLGRLVHWIRDDELSAIAFGLPVDRLRIVLFVFLALFSGLAGVGIVASQGYVSPRSFDLWLSLTVLTVVYLSGTGGNPLAMFAGAMTLVVLNELLRSFGSMPELVGPIQQIALNVILIAVLLVRQRGIAGPVIEFGPSANRLE
jgi:branched-chain amino acid transport system permease protein